MLRRAVAAMLWLITLLFCAAVIAGLLAIGSAARAAEQVPHAAQRYEGTLKREAQLVWGLQAPVATMAAQIQQESRWRTDAHSPVGADGLAQFMPPTARWLSGLYAGLADNAPRNPTWALRALVLYDKRLHDAVNARDECERMAFALSAYNGGLGWVYKRQKASPQPGVCLYATCTINPGISAAAQRENEGYSRLILERFEPLYAAWGPGSCS